MFTNHGVEILLSHIESFHCLGLTGRNIYKTKQCTHFRKRWWWNVIKMEASFFGYCLKHQTCKHLLSFGKRNDNHQMLLVSKFDGDGSKRKANKSLVQERVNKNSIREMKYVHFGCFKNSENAPRLKLNVHRSNRINAVIVWMMLENRKYGKHDIHHNSISKVKT